MTCVSVGHDIFVQHDGWDTTVTDLATRNLLHTDTVLDVDCADCLERHMRSAQRMTNLFLINVSMRSSIWASSYVSIGMEIQETIPTIV